MSANTAQLLLRFARAHLDAAHDAVGAGRGRDLDAVAFGLLHVGGGGEVDGRGVEPHVDGFDRARGCAASSRPASANTPASARRSKINRESRAAAVPVMLLIRLRQR